MFECRICGSKHERFKTIEGMYSHLEKVHGEDIPDGWSVQQYAYYLKTGKTHGNCVICKGKTKFNSATGKYYRLCGRKACSDKNREIFKNRMIGKYGKVSLLDDPEQQKKMLANRKISGTYTWSDGKKFTYTGSYELDFLRFLDVFLNFPSQDIECPSPHTYYYEYEGKKHFYIPDVYIQSLNLEIEVKDGGNNPNTHHKIQEVDKIKEALKDKVMLTQSAVSYVKVTNKEYDTFFKYLYKMKDQYNDKDEKFKPIFILGESAFGDEFTGADVLLEAPVDTSTGDYVFYVSSEPGLKTIRPSKSKAYPNLGEVIFASPFKEFATALGANLTKDHIKMISTVKGKNVDIKIELLDKYAPVENKFFIYVLSKEDFEPLVKDGVPSKVRYYKQGDAEVIREIKVTNWRRYINRFPNVKLINFPNDEEAKEIEKEKMRESYSVVEESGKAYFVSTSDSITKLTPRVPSNYMTKNGYEDGKTPRVCFAPSIDKCLMALSQKCTDMELYVYEPDGDYELYHPSVKEVPDSKITGEIWIKEPVKLKKVGKIKVIGDKGLEGHPYKYGDKTAELYDWDWKWMERVRETLQESLEVVDEACKSPLEARKFIQEVQKIAKKYDANYFIVTDGASATNNSGNPAVKVARDAVAKWERKHGFDDKEDWRDNPEDFSNYRLKESDLTTEESLEVVDEAYIKNEKEKMKESYEETILESTKSALDKNYRPKGKKNLSSFKRVHITEMVIDKYKKEYPFLKHVRCKDTKEYICDGYIWFDNNELVAMVGSCEYTDDKTKWVVSLEITKKYKGYGLSKQILDYAVKTMKCKYLSVNKNNKIAKKVYDDYGFKVYHEDNTMYYMTINKNVKESSMGMDTFTEVFGEGRDATVEEQQSVMTHIESISKETGINFWDDAIMEAKSIIDGDREIFTDNLQVTKEYGIYNDGTYNAIAELKGFTFKCRGRSELLVMKGNKVYLAKNKSGLYGNYSVPGGGWDKNEPHDKSAIREAEEESRLSTKNVQYGGNYLTVYDKPKKWVQEKIPKEDQWRGYYTEVFIGEYTGKFNGHIDEEDKDGIINIGKFYSFDEVKGILNPIHREIIEKYLREKGLVKESFEEVTNEIMNEAYIKNEKDIYYNKDKFDSGEINLCFITGHSGSGKSTMARNMTNKSNIEHYELDDVIANWNFSDDDLKEYGNLIYSFFRGDGKKFRYKSYEDWSNDSKWDTPDGNGDKYERELTPSFINYCKSYAKSQKDTKFVVEGVWLFHYIEPSELERYAVYVKGAGLLASKVRAAKRNASPMQTNFAKARVFLRAMTNFTNWKYRLLDEKRITKYRNYFGNKVEKNIKESTLTAEERNDLSNSDYGIPILKKYPMPDEAHVKSAIRFFNYVDEEYEELLAKNIKKKIKEFNMEVNVGKKNRLTKYL